jgi:aspartate beta-hydroxylase
MIFDDSYQHEVWNESNQTRIVLFFNVFHPDLQPHEVSQMKQFLYEELNRVPAVKFWNQSQADHHLGESTQMAL